MNHPWPTKPILYIGTIFLTLGLLASCSSDVNVNTSNELPEANISPEDLAALRAGYDTDGDGLFDHLDPCPDTPLNDQDGDGVCEVILSDINEDGCVNLQDQGILGTELRQSGEDLLADLLPDGVVNLLDVAVFGMENGQCQDNCPTVFNPDQNADACPQEESESPPYPPSDLWALSFDHESEERHGAGSDQWVMSWADDGHVYGVWGDGWGWSESGGKKSMGMTQIQGNPPGLTGNDVWGVAESVLDAKPLGFVADVNETMYLFRWNGSDHGSYGMKSTDNGQNWDTDYPKLFDYEDDGVMVVGIAQFGAGYSNVPAGLDGSVFYVYLSDRWNAGQDGKGKEVFLGKVPKADIFDRTAYVYFRGFDGSGDPTWTSSWSDKEPVFYDPAGMAYHVNVSYNPGIGRFIYAKGQDTADVGVFEGPTPWGPWATLYYGEFRDENSKFTFQFPQKWMSLDGLTMWMSWSGHPEHDAVYFTKATLTPAGGEAVTSLSVPEESDFIDQGVVLQPAAGTWEDRWDWSTPGKILKKDGTYFVYYVGASGDRADGGPAYRAVGLATSTDGRSWTKSPSNPVIPYSDLNTNGDDEEGSWRVAPMLDQDGTILLYLTELDGSGGSVNGSIKLFTSSDGETFTDHGIVADHADANFPGDDEIGVIGAVREPNGGDYHLFYTGKDYGGPMDWDIVHTSSASRDGFTSGTVILDLSTEVRFGSNPIQISDNEWIVPWGLLGGDIRLYRTSDLASLGTLETTWTTLTSGNHALYLDRESDEWLLLVAEGSAGDPSGLRLYTAPSE